MSKYSENMPPDLYGAIGWMYEHIKEGATLLDFGCSTGYFGALIKEQKHCKVYGLEISSDLEAARKVLDGVYSFDLDGEWPPEIYERKYDYLFFGDVLEHLKDPGLVLKKCKKLLRRNGVIFVSVPNVAHLSVRLELLQGNFEYESMGILDNTHLKYFTLRSFSQMTHGAGYELKVIDYTLSDFPKETATALLKQVGLVPKAAFWQLVKTPEARAFQYKFMLTPIAKSSQSDRPDGPIPQKPDQFRDAFISDLKDQVVKIDQHAKDQAKIIEHHMAEVERLKRQNNKLALQLAHAQSSIMRKLKNTTKRFFKKP